MSLVMVRAAVELWIGNSSRPPTRYEPCTL